jgi:hypothetical protein
MPPDAAQAEPERKPERELMLVAAAPAGTPSDRGDVRRESGAGEGALEDRRPTEPDVAVLRAARYLTTPVEREDPAGTARAVAALLNVGHDRRVIDFAVRLVVEAHRAHTGPGFDDFDFLQEVQALGA